MGMFNLLSLTASVLRDISRDAQSDAPFAKQVLLGFLQNT